MKYLTLVNGNRRIFQTLTKILSLTKNIIDNKNVTANKNIIVNV